MNAKVGSNNSQKKTIADSTILVLGLAYKPDVGDDRESPSFPIIEKLMGLGGNVSYHDPFIAKTPKTRKYNLKMASQELSDSYLSTVDVALIVTGHTLVDYERIVNLVPLVVDTRNMTKDLESCENQIFRA